jgi:hypothetical protein
VVWGERVNFLLEEELQHLLQLRGRKTTGFDWSQLIAAKVVPNQQRCSMIPVSS